MKFGTSLKVLSGKHACDLGKEFVFSPRSRAMTAHGVRQMLKRRLHEAGLPEIITPHSFRVMVVTDLLGQKRAHGGRAVPGGALQSSDHPDL